MYYNIFNSDFLLLIAKSIFNLYKKEAEEDHKGSGMLYLWRNFGFI